MNMHACALQVEVEMDGANDMDDSEWYERVWELPLTYEQQCLALHLLFKSQLPQEELELLVPHDKELAVANIKAMLAKCRCRMRNAVGGSCVCAAIMSRRIASTCMRRGNQRTGRGLQV